MISEELWEKCQTIRASRCQQEKKRPITRHVYLLNGIIVCSQCGRRLRAQTPKGQPGYYREMSHANGFQDCPYSHNGVRSMVIDGQNSRYGPVAETTFQLGRGGQENVAKKDVGSDPEIERKEIREKLRRLRVGYEHGLYMRRSMCFGEKWNPFRKS